ncbi:MAG: D-2-hydroxyacid dehydrogenase [Chloroflexi bacterium]|nr:D-2-hydroxyacid dehydrogenase [Chloroflexota bacterium]
MKVVVGSAISDEHLHDLRASFPDVTFRPASTEEAQKREIADADVFFGRPTREVFLAADRLRWVQWMGTGIDEISSVSELIDSDVVLTNMPGAHAAAMADHALGMIVALAHRGRELWEDQRQRRWDTAKYDGRMVELSGSTMGILALGDIGRAVARRADAFGMEVYAVDIRPTHRPPEVKEVWGEDRLDDLLGISDWFVVTVPLTSKSRGMLDRRRLGLLKPGGYLIVMSRGGIVDEGALLEGLRAGRIAGAGLDVFDQEPLPPENPFWDMTNVVISPHISALTPEMWEGRRQIFKENLKRFLANEPFLYVCDKREGF